MTLTDRLKAIPAGAFNSADFPAACDCEYCRESYATIQRATVRELLPLIGHEDSCAIDTIHFCTCARAEAVRFAEGQ